MVLLSCWRGLGGGEIDDGVDGIDGDGNVDTGADVDVLGGGLANLRLPPSLSEPHDPPYSTQPYAAKPSQFHDSTNPNTTPYKFPTVGAGDSAMGRGMPCQGHHTMVQPYNV